ncbi:MAG: GNAT family N-acetyltransferase [Lachnospiraceae bacterium]|nr:GNAT family N-acetyltransferase [Lachnospiraceae bacterium]
MNFRIEKINITNYSLFDDMVFWRENGFERKPSQTPVSDQMKKELANPNLYVYAVMVESRYVGWISLIYIPKVGSRWNGHGHIYVDELWVEQNFRGRGFAEALMRKAEDLRIELEATGIRLYVNVNNPIAKKLYEHCGYLEDGQAYFMEK